MPPNDLRLTFDAWNWQPDFPEFEADFDNVYAFGDLDLTEGLIDDFEDGTIDSIWSVTSAPGTSVYEANGVLNVDIPAGEDVDVGGVVGLYLVSVPF